MTTTNAPITVGSPPNQTPIANIKTGLTTWVWSSWFSLVYNALRKIVDYSQATRQIVVSGFALAAGDATTCVTLVPAGTIATGTLTLPANPKFDGQPFEVSTTNTVTALTIAAPGQTINNAPTTLLAGTGFKFYWVAMSKTWYRVY